MKSETRKVIARNRGLVLRGVEIKSIRASQANIQDGYVQETDGELWLLGVHIAPYAQASGWDDLDPTRPRKLLLNKKEIVRISTMLRERGLSAIPTQHPYPAPPRQRACQSRYCACAW
ncbi:MAG: SsrA-binding protein [Anaerolineae bacterium]|nr:SsrA-binding protein [Anaerolineae bacterium]